MDRVNKIISHRDYIYNMNKVLKAEENRVYCRHNLQHFLDVARVGYIVALERNFNVNKELIYAASLLHDVGRWKQYQDGTDHAEYSAKLSGPILKDCGFSSNEGELILEAIRKHRKGINLITELEIALYEGDKMSRPCVGCLSLEGCNRFTTEETPTISY